MPRYFFDVADGERVSRDDSGTEMPDRKAARDAAIGLLPNVARDVLPDGDRHEFVVRVRDEAGKYVFQATLSLVAEWLE